MIPTCQEALAALTSTPGAFIVTPVNVGLINHTYKIRNGLTNVAYLLQRINKQVFPEPEKIQENYRLIAGHIANRNPGFFIPQMQYFKNGQSLFCDSDRYYWRLFSYVDNSRTLSLTEDPEQAAAVAETFARMTAACKEVDIQKMHHILPGFHDVAGRLDQFSTAVVSAIPERLKRSHNMVNGLNSRSRYARLFTHFTRSADYTRRVTHHDAKISNVLFDMDSGNILCPVDFDTIMPGYFFSDPGDMIRSMAGTTDENSTDLAAIRIRPEIYEAIIAGYLSGMRNELSPAEINNIHTSGLLLIYMQSLRFLSDYLTGDQYYRISYPEQNFDRALNQLTLLERLEEFLEARYNFTC